MIVSQEDKLYSYGDALLVCTHIKPFSTILSQLAYGWFGILFPVKNFNEFDHFLWSHVRPAAEFFVKLTASQKRAIIRKSFRIRDIEKKYL